MILFGGSPRYSVCGLASAPQQGHQQHWDRIFARTRAREEAQDGLHGRPWRVKDETGVGPLESHGSQRLLLYGETLLLRSHEII